MSNEFVVSKRVVVTDPALSGSVRRVAEREGMDVEVGVALLLVLAAVGGTVSGALLGVLPGILAALVLAGAASAYGTAPALVRSRHLDSCVDSSPFRRQESCALLYKAKREADSACVHVRVVEARTSGLTDAGALRRAVESDLWEGARLLREADRLSGDLRDLGVVEGDPAWHAAQACMEAARAHFAAITAAHDAARRLDQSTDLRWAGLADRADEVRALAAKKQLLASPTVTLEVASCDEALREVAALPSTPVSAPELENRPVGVGASQPLVQ